MIYNPLQSILNYLRGGGEAPTLVQHYDSSFDRTLILAWEEQRAIGWDQILKGRLSSGWGRAQNIYYRDNPETCTKKHCSMQVWMVKPIGSLLDFTMGLWTDRCNILHGATKAEKKITHNWVQTQVARRYANKDKVSNNFKYLFEEDIGKLRSRYTQYLDKWLAIYRLTIRQKRNSNNKKTANRTRKTRRSKALCGVEGQQTYTRIKYYSAAHARSAHTTPQRDRQRTGGNTAPTVRYEVDRQGGVSQCQGGMMGVD